jgi:hypothetical protein
VGIDRPITSGSAAANRPEPPLLVAQMDPSVYVCAALLRPLVFRRYSSSVYSTTLCVCLWSLPCTTMCHGPVARGARHPSSSSLSCLRHLYNVSVVMCMELLTRWCMLHKVCEMLWAGHRALLGLAIQWGLTAPSQVAALPQTGPSHRCWSPKWTPRHMSALPFCAPSCSVATHPACIAQPFVCVYGHCHAQQCVTGRWP